MEAEPELVSVVLGAGVVMVFVSAGGALGASLLLLQAARKKGTTSIELRTKSVEAVEWDFILVITRTERAKAAIAA